MTLSLLFRELDDGVASDGGDTALVVLVTGHHDVPFQAPVGAPTVLHQPIRLAVILAVAYHQHGVVQVVLALLAAGFAVHSCPTNSKYLHPT